MTISQNIKYKHIFKKANKQNELQIVPDSQPSRCSPQVVQPQEAKVKLNLFKKNIMNLMIYTRF